MKKYISLFIAAILMAGSLTACSSGEGTTDQDSNTIQIVTTIFPEYDWVQNILGDNPANAEVTLLLDNGVDLHSYQPTAEDILKISTCDLFLYVGGESDEYVEDALQEAANKDMVVINLLDVLGDKAKEEELVEGMEMEVEEEDDSEEDEPEFDEHVWLSLRNASLFCDSISEALASIDAENADIYKTNTESYKEKLQALDEEYQNTVSKASVKTLLFGDRFPFRYLVDDYDLDYYAAFTGCSAETEASFQTIAFLAQKVDELSLESVMTIEGSDQKIAETIIQNTVSKNQKILSLNSMQSATSNDSQNGTSYLSVMESNLDVLKEALK